MRLKFFIIVVLLSVVDALLLARPNLLGKIGLWIYKYSYLRTFPRAMLTVSIVVGSTIIVSELIILLATRKWIRKTGVILITSLILACSGLLTKLFLDFSKGIYSHTGVYFKYGALLLPLILIVVFIAALIRFVKKIK